VVQAADYIELSEKVQAPVMRDQELAVVDRLVYDCKLRAMKLVNQTPGASQAVR
jgi:hypothetical protein